MKIVVAPDKFKGCLSAVEVAQCIAAGISSVLIDAIIDQCPVADGGEGTVDAILKAVGGRLITRRVTGPLPEMKVDASFALLADGRTAVIEMSAASGLALLKPQEQNPLYTTTFGTGELIVAAIKEGAKKIILGLGGSATIDAGIGCAQACGFTVLMKDGQSTSMSEPLCGQDLPNVLMVKHGRGEMTAGIEIVGATDVTNPLFGPSGAPQIFGAQKGASSDVILMLDDALKNLSQRMGAQTWASQIGAGAAGGFGFGLLAFMNGKLANGFQLISQTVGLKDRLANADLCITGEGQIDDQTLGGKTVAGVAQLCRHECVPCIAIVGSSNLTSESMYSNGLTSIFSIADGPMSLQDSVKNAKFLIAKVSANCARLWLASKPSQKSGAAPDAAGAAPLQSN